MIVQFDTIDQVDENKWQVFSSMIGEDNYLKGQAIAVQMYIMEKRGIPYSLIPESVDMGDY